MLVLEGLAGFYRTVQPQLLLAEAEVHAPTSNAEEAEWFYEDLRPTRPFRTNTQKRCPFHYWRLECNSRKSRNTWSKGKFGLGMWNEAGQRLIELPRKCTGHSRHPLPTAQEKSLHMDITKIRLIIFFAAKDGEPLYSQQKQDQELTVAQIMNLLQNSDAN